MESYLGLIEAAFVFLVLIGIAVIELVSLRIDRKRRKAKADAENRGLGPAHRPDTPRHPER
jgi:hypothetical protein